MAVVESITKGTENIAYHAAMNYAWLIGRQAKSVKAYRAALYVILWKISAGSKTGGERFDPEEAIKQLPEIPQDILDALRG